MITETSTLGGASRREAWMDESLATVRRLRSNGAPVVGYTWWPMFSLVSWRWRSGRKATASYLGHVGLWDLHEDAGGSLERRATVLVDRFRACAADTLAVVGPLAEDGMCDREDPG